MAGLAKPNIENLGPEVVCTIGEYFFGYGANPNLLFDGLVDTNIRFENTNYVVLTIPHKCNIWRTVYEVGYNNEISIYQLINGVYVDVNWKYTQTVGDIAYPSWEKTIPNLQAGTYKFVSVNHYQRLDSEWYLEYVEDEYITKDNLSNVLIPALKETRRLALADTKSLTSTLSEVDIINSINTINLKTWGTL